MESTKVESCQKYYFFTAWDIVNNSFHVVGEKRMESLEQLSLLRELERITKVKKL